uniref:Uncharacterized protein n=1 Tax=Psilocybe cubensis TaxID=181762 RepID=A0A8H7Y109_PSICU
MSIVQLCKGPSRIKQITQIPSSKSSEIYYRHLAAKQRGSPLWIPEPNSMLPVEYQKQGIGVGDVGILTDYGAFDYLFNILLPQDNPINPEDMPTDYFPLQPPLSLADIHGYSAFKTDSHLTSLTFESSASEGAILTMPCGCNSKDLRNIFRFRKYAVANAEKWYRYANEIRGRDAKNGDVRLVIGYDSTTAWGMAAFANLSEKRYSRLKFRPVGGNSLGRIYGWEYSGITMAEVKSGPDFYEIEKLRNLARGPDAEEAAVQKSVLVSDLWNKLAEEWEMLYLDDGPDVVRESTDDSRATTNFSSGSAGVSSNSGQSLDTCMQDDQEMSRDFSTFQHNSAFVSLPPTTLNIHPSQTINEFLLKERPNSKVAISDDHDWISVLEKNDRFLPPPQTLLDRIRKRYDIYEEEDMASLQPKILPELQTEEFQLVSLDLEGDSQSQPEKHPPFTDFQSTNILTPAQTVCKALPPSPSPFSKANNAPELTIAGASNAMKVFCKSFNWLPLRNLKKGDYQILKSGIPMWKLSVDGRGGHWVLILEANLRQDGLLNTRHALAITAEEIDGDINQMPMTAPRKDKLVQVTSVGMIVIRDDNVYKLPWGCW